jgi:thymidine phosphorylase
MLGGPPDFCDRHESYLQKANIIEPIYAESSGVVESMDTIGIGMAVVGLGGGRIKPTDEINHSVGLENIISLGEEVDSSTVLTIIHAKDKKSFDEAKKRVLCAIKIGDQRPEVKEVYEIIYA